MKSVRRSKDFSIENILADTVLFIQNDPHEKASLFSVSNNSNIDIQKQEECEMNPETTFIENTFESDNGSPSLNLITKFEVTMNKMYLINNMYKNHEFSKRVYCDACFQQKSEDNIEDNYELNLRKINFGQCKQREHHKNLLNITKCEDNHLYKISDTIKKCITDMEATNLITVDYNEINNLKVMKHIEEKYPVNLKKNKSEEFNINYKEINDNYYNIKINQRQKDIVNLKEEQRRHCKIQQKQLKQDETVGSSNSQLKYENNDYDSQLQTKNKDPKIHLYREPKKIEDKCIFVDNRNNKLRKWLKNKTENLEVMCNMKKLEWLHCTRYKPPKIPRKSTIGKNRRKPSLQPRIPFSTFQLDFLEQKFRDNAYLSKNDVLEISDDLNLQPNKVKIWFQNRRARERREFYNITNTN